MKNFVISYALYLSDKVSLLKDYSYTGTKLYIYIGSIISTSNQINYIPMAMIVLIS